MRLSCRLIGVWLRQGDANGQEDCAERQARNRTDTTGPLEAFLAGPCDLSATDFQNPKLSRFIGLDEMSVIYSARLANREHRDQ